MCVPDGAPTSDNMHGKAAGVGHEFVQGGFGPASTTLIARGQRARCVATDRMTLHLTAQAALAAARKEVATSAARSRASKWMKDGSGGFWSRNAKQSSLLDVVLGLALSER